MSNTNTNMFVIYKGILRFGVSNTNTNINRNANAIYDRILRFPGVNNSIEASAEALDAATTLRLGSPTSLGRASCLRSILSPLHAILSRVFAPKLCFLAVPSRVYCPVGILWSGWIFMLRLDFSRSKVPSGGHRTTWE